MARILVINDDDTILDTYEAVIRGLGHEAVTKRRPHLDQRSSATWTPML